MRRRAGGRDKLSVWRWGAALAGPCLLVAGCGGSAAPKAVPTPGTQTPAPISAQNPASATTYSPSQVLGWVTPTLQNGASLVSTLPPTSSDADVLAGAQQLAVACGVSLKELTQTTWRGAALRDEQHLSATVTQIQGLIASPPAGGLGSALRPMIVTMDGELTGLQRDLG